MARKPSLDTNDTDEDNIVADVIVLGRSLPGIVAAHRLREKFGETMDIVVLDLSGNSGNDSSRNVTFQVQPLIDEPPILNNSRAEAANIYVGNIAHNHIMHYMSEFNIPVPEGLFRADVSPEPSLKLFQYPDGKVVSSVNDYHDFSYLSIFQRLELKNYQNLLDRRTNELFRSQPTGETDRRTLMYYDRTSMEEDLANFLLLTESRELMRVVIRIVCGAPARSVSLLFYLHQCYRTGGTCNHVDGTNTRLREKLLGYCRKRLTRKLCQSVEDITMLAKPIREIRIYSDERLIVETVKGDCNYVCNRIAMAMRPEELSKISVEDRLLSNLQEAVETVRDLRPRYTKRFKVKYDNNFWRCRRLSGEILSIRGPILWAIEKPEYSMTGSLQKYSTLVGFLKAEDEESSREAVLAQLVKLFGSKAASPIEYQEMAVQEAFVPRCGDYVGLRGLAAARGALVDWSALDVFADGDLAAALEAGHTTYVHLVRALRPQAQDFDDILASQWRSVLPDTSFGGWFSTLSYSNAFRYVIYGGAVYLGYALSRKYILRR